MWVCIYVCVCLKDIATKGMRKENAAKSVGMKEWHGELNRELSTENRVSRYF